MKDLPNYEKSVHEGLQQIYDTLLSMKNNRAHYISSKQVYTIYDQFLTLLKDLRVARKDEELKGMTLNLPNVNDRLIDDIWQLVSLCFVTCGLTKFAPATYSSLSTVYKLLLHLKDCRVYTKADLKPISHRLDEIRQILDQSYQDDEQEENSNRSEEYLLLRFKLKKCQDLYSELEEAIKSIPTDLQPVYGELLAIRKGLLNYVTAAEPNEATLSELKDRLKKVEHQRDEEGKFHSELVSADKLLSNQMVLDGLLDDCNNIINDLSAEKDKDLDSLFEKLSISDVDKAAVTKLKTMYLRLLDLKQTLESLLVTRRWTLRETDLYTYQKHLKEIEEERTGLELTPAAQKDKNVKKLQLVIIYILRRCYSLIYKLLESSEPVSESLQPIHNQLSTVRRCLLELKRIDGLNNLRELYPFQFKLASLDNLRRDGKFIVNNQIPEGQGTLNALLAECFDILHELKIELEEKEENRNSSDEEVTDEEDKMSDDEVELKRSRFVGFNEADYDRASQSSCVSDSEVESDSEYEGNDYY
ncbi:hypothetical protein JA9_000991 [Meyerozyma sp. JA9]|nr:hypothetical protein JA9_000991 [Meyerozyma sp. JA9]